MALRRAPLVGPVRRIGRGWDNKRATQDTRFILAATPSGISLPGEGGAHQWIRTLLIGMAQGGLASFEPAYMDELAVILRRALEHVQRLAGDMQDPGGSVYLRLSTRRIAQPQHHLGATDAADITAGGY